MRNIVVRCNRNDDDDDDDDDGDDVDDDVDDDDNDDVTSLHGFSLRNGAGKRACLRRGHVWDVSQFDVGITRATMLTSLMEKREPI